jgi:hypothetical protein
LPRQPNVNTEQARARLLGDRTRGTSFDGYRFRW